MKIFQVIELLPRLTPGHQQQVMAAVWGNVSAAGRKRLLDFHSRYQRNKDSVEFRQRLVEEVILVVKSEIDGVGRSLREAEKLAPLTWDTIVELKQSDDAAEKKLEAIYHNASNHSVG